MAKVGSRAVDLSIDARDFHRVLTQAKAFDKKLYTRLRRNLRAAAADAVKGVRAEVVKPPMKSVTTRKFHIFKKTSVVESATVNFSRHTLRQHIADGVKVKIAATESSKKVGVFIESRGSDPASKALKRSFDRPKGWRHPVFGTDTWVPQLGRPYFGSTVERRAPQIEKAVKQALEDATNEIPKH